MFGQSSGQGLFGSQPQNQGGGLFGQPQQQPGVNATYGGLGSMLGEGMSGQQQQQGGLFGGVAQPQPLGMFGAPQVQPQQPQQGGLFGSAPQQSQFGQPQQQSTFGQPQQQQGSLFGGIGQPQQQQQSGAFGGGGGLFGQNKPATTGFGQSFGQQQPQQQQSGLFGGGGGLGGGGLGGGGLGGGGLGGGGLGLGGGLGAVQGGGLGGPLDMNRGQTVMPQQQQWGQQQMTFGQQQPQQQPQPAGFGGNAQDDSSFDLNIDVQSSKLEDSISQIVWAIQQPRYLAVSTWEGKVRIYEVVSNGNRSLVERKQFQIDNPLLCLDVKPDMSMIFCGTGLDNRVIAIDVPTGSIGNVGVHNASVMAVYWIEQGQMLFSFSYDNTLKVWDPKTPMQPKFQLQFQYKPLVADFVYPKLIVGFTNEKIGIFDMTQLHQIKNVHYFDSPLGLYSQLTSIALFQNGDGFGIGSIDGRGHMSNIISKPPPSYGGPCHYEFKSIMTFKAHKIEETQNGRTNSYFFPVNSLQFNSRCQQFLMTAGAEGQMIYWDYGVRNKVKTFNYNNNPVVCSRMSPDGQMLAYALGYDFSKGAEYYSHFQNKLCVHFIPDNELKCAQR